MARPLRYLPPECPLVEVTCRTLQGRLLLRPSRALNQLVLGVLARAACRYRVGVCAFVFLSNHCHLLVRPRSARDLSAFMNYLNSNIAREAGRLYRWRERFWGRRYRAIAVSDEPEAQVGRLEYLLAQGCKEGLVGRPQDWPGATSVRALLDDEPITGIWHDRTEEYWARRRGTEVEPGQFATEEGLVLEPLPCWDGLRPEAIRDKVRELVAGIVAAARERVRKTGRRPLGRRRILRQHPHDRPSRSQRSPAPRFHAASWEIRRMLEAMYRAYRDAYAEASDSLRRHRLPVSFPAHGIPPPMLSVPASL